MSRSNSYYDVTDIAGLLASRAFDKNWNKTYKAALALAGLEIKYLQALGEKNIDDYPEGQPIMAPWSTERNPEDGWPRENMFIVWKDEE